MSEEILVKIFIDGQSKLLKKLKKSDNLKTIRDKIGDKIPKNTVFVLDDTEIDTNDEERVALEEILQGKVVNIKTVKDPNEIEVEIFVNDVMRLKKKLIKTNTLFKIRQDLGNVVSNDSIFLGDGVEVDTNDESDLILSDILDKNQLKIKSENELTAPSPAKQIMENKKDSDDGDTPEEEEKIKEEKISVEIYIDGELKFNKKMKNSEELKNIRTLLGNKIQESHCFTNISGEIIKEEEEKKIKLYKILKDNKVYFETQRQNKAKEDAKGKTEIEFYVNEELCFTKKVNIKESLKEIREKIRKKLPEETSFLQKNGTEADEDDEEDYRLEEIIDNGKVKMKSPNKVLNKPNDEKEKTKEGENYYMNGIEENRPIQGSQRIAKDGVIDIYQYPYEDIIFSEEENKRVKRLMVIGPTGSGKTTLLNSYINYLMGIKYNDNFRYKIIHENFGTGQHTSQTTEVSSYNIRAKDGQLYQIIDTPGFGDTGGIKVDIKITEKITNFFLNCVDSINAVCLVSKSTENRLSATQKYIFNCVFDLFGEDTKKLFIAMLTFSDGGEANALDFLRSEGCLLSQFIEDIKGPWYFKFNNSAILKKNVDDPLNLTFWNIGMDSFEKFTEKLIKLPSIKLDQTRQVLNERSRLTQYIEILEKSMKNALNKIETIKGYYKMIYELQGDMKDSKNFTRKVKTPKTKKVPFSETGRYMTTCLICTKTCHSNCYIKDDDNKKGCACIGSNGYCRKCPGKCHWKEHKNRPYEIVDYFEEEVVTLEDLKKRYCDSTSKLDARSQMLQGAKREFIALNKECLDIQDELYESINRLKMIALNKNVFESTEEYIDLLIDTEKNEHKEGWQNRVNGLFVLKKQRELLRQYSQGKPKDMETINSFLEQCMKKDEELIKSFYDNDLSQKNDNCLIF